MFCMKEKELEDVKTESIKYMDLGNVKWLYYAFATWKKVQKYLKYYTFKKNL